MQGPYLLEKAGPAGSLAQWVGFPELMGPYGGGFIGLILAGSQVIVGVVYALGGYGMWVWRQQRWRR